MRIACLLPLFLFAACTVPPKAPVQVQPLPVQVPESPPPEPIVIAPPRIGLALGGGAARGFAHVGVIKALESQGFKPEFVAGTSAGSLVAALYAAGNSGFDLQRIALDLDEKAVSDWTLPNRGFIKGESLQNYVNAKLANRPIEKLPLPLAIVATDLASGESVVFRRGNAGMAVRASSAVPGVFQPVAIGGREFVDGGVTSPVPVRAARELGADFVIAVDIGKRGTDVTLKDTVDVLLQSITVMGRVIAAQEGQAADVVISPDTSRIATTSFESRNLAILEGEQAAMAALPRLRQKLAEREARLRKAAEAAAGR
jgi:NTE family protein